MRQHEPGTGGGCWGTAVRAWLGVPPLQSTWLRTCYYSPGLPAVRITKIRQPTVELVPPWIAPPIRSPCSFFPFRLCRQAFPGPSAVRFRALPAHVYHRVLLQPRNAAAWSVRRAPGSAIAPATHVICYVSSYVRCNKSLTLALLNQANMRQ
jgi:hypothetical protein